MAETDPAGALLSSPVRRRILDVLGEAERSGPDRLGAEGLTAAQLAKQLSLHVTTVRFHLDQLVAGGLVEASFHKHIGAGRPRKVYARARRPRPPASSKDSLLLLSTLLTEAFAAQEQSRRPISPDEAGRRWARENVPLEGSAPANTPGQWIAKLGHAIDVLSDWGYDPELTADGGSRDARIELSHCPFRELARENPDVVCGIHRGLIAGTMAQLGEPETTVDLHPFADGHRCIARIQSPAPSGSSGPGPTTGPTDADLQDPGTPDTDLHPDVPDTDVPDTDVPDPDVPDTDVPDTDLPGTTKETR